MTSPGSALTGLAYPRLVPSSLLPPEDPSGEGVTRRTVRDWVVDVSAFLLSVVLGFGLLMLSNSGASDPLTATDWLIDWVLGSVACLAVTMRRRRPIAVGVLTGALTAFSAFAGVAGVVGLFTAAVHRRTILVLPVVAVNIVASAVFTWWRPDSSRWWVSMTIGVVATAIITAWGMLVRARRQLVWTLRRRAELAEAEQHAKAEQARQAERTRIAREMHDVLAHRVSMIALHAGGLQLRPDLPPEQVRETAELLHATAHQALEELRGVIGVLRDPASASASLTPPAPAAPQPGLRDIPRLVADTRSAGSKIDFAMTVPEDAEPTTALGRDAYRIVQEALTNVAKHARGTATCVRVSGAPGDGLEVEVRNRLPVGTRRDPLPGSGSGLLGLRERVALAGGTLEHGPTEAGEFVVAARLAWPGAAT